MFFFIVLGGFIFYTFKCFFLLFLEVLCSVSSEVFGVFILGGFISLRAAEKEAEVSTRETSEQCEAKCSADKVLVVFIIVITYLLRLNNIINW